MKKSMIFILLCMLLSLPVSAMEFTAPVPEGQAQKYMPQNTESFGEGLWEIVTQAAYQLLPELTAAAATCLSILAVILLASITRTLTEMPAAVVELTAVCLICGLLWGTSGSLIKLGVETVTELSQYSKLFLPVMTGALAAQGGLSTSVSLYTATTLFIGIVTTVITGVITPLLYAFLAVSTAECALENHMLSELRKFIRWLMLWILKLSIYLFTGYIAVTGVVSGTTDAAALKATKLAMSGFVPVVGGVIADASEAVLTSAAFMKNTAGIYGILATVSILIGPFVKVGSHYLLLKLTASIGSLFGEGKSVLLVKSFSSLMGYILGLIGSVSIMLLIGTVCFMRGMA